MYDVVLPLENGGPLFGDTAREILHFNSFFFSMANPLSYSNTLHSIFVNAYHKGGKGDKDIHHNILSVRMNFTLVALDIF